MSFKLTIDLDVGGFPVGSTPTDIAKAITSCYPDHESLRVLSIQQYPKKVARVTFDKPVGRVKLMDAKELRMGEEFGGITCRVIPPPVPPTPWSTVVVYNYPYEFPNELVESVMSGYGEVGRVRFQSWVGLPGVSTGTRLVRIRRKYRIPRFLYIGNFRCKVWYKGQPVVCDICNTEGHTAGTCPLKGKCRLCLEPGHMARSCPEYCYHCRGSHPGVECPRIWGNRPLLTTEEGVDVIDNPPLGSSLDGPSDGLSGPVPDGPVPPPAAADPPAADLRYNQLDELGSQSSESSMSQSILPNLNACNASSNGSCNVSGTSNVMNESNANNESEANNVMNESNVSNEGESSNVMNLNNVRNETSNVMNESNTSNEGGTSNVMDGSNQINVQLDSQIDGLIGVGQNDGEASSMEFISPPVPSPGDIRPVTTDVEIADASGARKRPADDLSDDSGGASAPLKVSAGHNTRKSKSSKSSGHVVGDIGRACTLVCTPVRSSRS